MKTSLFAVRLVGKHARSTVVLRLSVVAATFVLTTPGALAQSANSPSIGRMLSAVGTVTLEPKGGTPQLVGLDTELRVGDVVQTQTGSSAALRYIDGTQVQLGQRSRMTVSEFAVNAQQPAEERFVARLFTGAMRVVTGLVAKRRPDNARFSTSTTTVGIRGTDFVMRECAADCILGDATSTRGREVARASEELAGRLASAAAAVGAAPANGPSRPLQITAPFRAGETLSTGASAALFVLRDGTRIALDPNSSLVVRTFEFDEFSLASGRLALLLVRGKAQILAGRVARARADAMSLQVGQVLVRPGLDAAFGAALQTGPGSELVQIAVSAGSVGLQGRSGTSYPRVEAGSVVTLQNGDAPVAGTTLAFESGAPGDAAVDAGQLFGASVAQPLGFARPGTYVFVDGGAIVLEQDGRELLVTPGETGFANVIRGPLERINSGVLVAGITALGLQLSGSASVCRADGTP